MSEKLLLTLSKWKKGIRKVREKDKFSRFPTQIIIFFSQFLPMQIPSPHRRVLVSLEYKALLGNRYVAVKVQILFSESSTSLLLLRCVF